MSTDSRVGVDPRPAVGAVLEHPLVGLERRRTAVAVAYLTVLVGLFAVSYAGTTVTIDGTVLDTTVPWFDTISAWLIALSTATFAIAPFVYAVWNGGPALAFAMPLVPIVLGYLAAGRYVLDLDGAIALTVGGAASALAWLATDARRTGSLRPWRSSGFDVTLPCFVAGATVVAAVGVGRYLLAVPPRSLEWYAPFAVLWLVPLVVVGAYCRPVVRIVIGAVGDDRTNE